MNEDRSANWGLLAMAASAIFGLLAYGVASMGPPPSLEFGVAESMLLICVLVMIVDLIAKTARAR